MIIELFSRKPFVTLHLSLRYFTTSMAKSKFEYVKEFESDRYCLPNCWIIIRLDGKGFHKFSDIHKFEKPNDKRGLDLMTRAAASVFEELHDICYAFGHSDEYSFVFRKTTSMFNRRHDKLLSLVTSRFSSAYVFHWQDYFGSQKLDYPPTFDGRVILYPSDLNLRDYFSWRQADVHVNNLHNTVFWALVMKKKYTTKQVSDRYKMRPTRPVSLSQAGSSSMAYNYGGSNWPNILSTSDLSVSSIPLTQFPRSDC